MKRTLPLFVLIGVAGLLVSALAVFGESPSTPKGERHGYYPSTANGTNLSGSYSVPCCPPPSSDTKPASENDKIIEELTAILKQTKSADTFLVTAAVLGRMGPEAKRAIPVIIRNAERLELFDDLYKANASAENGAAQEVIAALEMILDKKAVAKGRIWGSQAPTCYTPAIGYGSTPPAPCVSPSYASPAYSPAPNGWPDAPAASPAPSAPAAKPAKPAQPIGPSTS